MAQNQDAASHSEHTVIELQSERSERPVLSPESPNVQTWVKFEDESKEPPAATIIPSQSIHVATASPPINDPLLRRGEKDSIGDNSHVTSPLDVTRTVTPPPPKPPLRGTKTNSASPARTVPPPQNPQRTAHKTPSIPPTFCSPTSLGTGNMQDGVSGELQNIPLQDVTTNPQQQSCNHVRQGFANGDIVVSLLPGNTHCAWVTKAEFKPELVPEELMAQGLTLTVEDYVMAMQVLVNDVRFNMYIVCYKRVLMMWILLGFIILLSLLFSGIRGLALFGGGIIWLIVNAVGIFVCMWLKIKLYRMLERCMASVNAMLHKHKILVGLDDRGKISCHKVHKYLNDMLENDERRANAQSAERNSVVTSTANPIDRSRMDIDTSDIIITGASQTHLSQKEKYAEKLLMRYSQRWVKEFVRKRLDLSLPLYSDGISEAGPPIPPRHCPTARCPCQFIEEHLRFKPLSKCSIRELFT